METTTKRYFDGNTIAGWVSNKGYLYCAQCRTDDIAGTGGAVIPGDYSVRPLGSHYTTEPCDRCGEVVPTSW